MGRIWRLKSVPRRMAIISLPGGPEEAHKAGTRMAFHDAGTREPEDDIQEVCKVQEFSVVVVREDEHGAYVRARPAALPCDGIFCTKSFARCERSNGMHATLGK